MPADLPTLQRSPIPRQRLSSTDVTECLAAVWLSVGLRARELYDLPPLLGFFRDALSIFGRREGEHRAPKVGEARLHLGVGESGVDFSVEFVNDFGRRVPRRADAAPGTGLKTRHKLTHCRDVGEFLQARGD